MSILAAQCTRSVRAAVGQLQDSKDPLQHTQCACCGGGSCSTTPLFSAYLNSKSAGIFPIHRRFQGGYHVFQRTISQPRQFLYHCRHHLFYQPCRISPLTPDPSFFACSWHSPSLYRPLDPLSIYNCYFLQRGNYFFLCSLSAETPWWMSSY